MPVVPNMVRGEDGEWRVKEETRPEFKEGSVIGETFVSNSVAGSQYDHAVNECIQEHSFLGENNSLEEIGTWAREWVRDDAKRERTRLIFGEMCASAPPVVFEIIERSNRIFDEHLHPLAGTSYFTLQKELLSGLVSTLIGMKRHEELKSLSSVIEAFSIRDFQDANDPFWKTRAGRIILIWNSGLKQCRLVEKQELWDRYNKSGATMALNKFYALLKRIGLNGLPGEIHS